jgi:hypothetical protein
VAPVAGVALLGTTPTKRHPAGQIGNKTMAVATQGIAVVGPAVRGIFG